MATSYTYTETRTATQLITDAHVDIGVHDPDESLASGLVTIGIRKLNNIIYQFKGAPNRWVRGLKVWQHETGTLTLVEDQGSYDLKPETLAYTSGGTGEVSVGDTITGATSEATATIVSISLTSGTWAGGDAAGNFTIENQSGTFVSENLNISSQDNIATITADSTLSDLPILPPEEILTCNLKHITSSAETPMTPMSLEEYQAISNKTSSGPPSRYYYEKRKETNGKLYFDNLPSSSDASAYQVSFVYRQPLENVIAGANELDFPNHCYRALEYQLALDLCPSFGVKGDTYKEIKDLRNESTALMNSFEPEDCNTYFQPGVDE